MSFLFGSSQTPSVAPLPESPAKSETAEAERIQAERAAIAAAKSGGRRSTIVGGMTISEEDQGPLERTPKRREAARRLGG